MMELLISIAILGVVAVAFLGALIAGYRGVRVSNDQTMAQSLTRTAMENVATAGYPVNPEGADQVTTTDRFDVVVHAQYIDAAHEESGSPTDLQMITVTVRYHDGGKTIKVTQCVKAKQ